MKGKKTLALLLALGMVVSAAACGTKDTKEGNEVNSEQSSTATDESVEAGAIDFDEEPYEVAIQVVTIPGMPSEGVEEREAAINEITVPAINCKVDIQEVWISEVGTKTSMAIAGGEKIDLIHVATVQPLSTMVGNDMLYDMNQDNLLQSRGQDILKVYSEDLIAAGSIDGKQLAVPANTYCAQYSGIYYNKDIADANGIEIPEKITFEELTEILQKVHEADPSIYPFYMGDGQGEYNYYFEGYDNFDQKAAYGVIFNKENNTTIENLYASDIYKNYALTLWKWAKEGLQPGDPTDTTMYSDYFKAGKLFCGVGAYNVPSEINLQASYPDIQLGFAEMVSPIIRNNAVTEYMWGIAATSERPDKAMDFLNYVHANAEVANILSYGLEGVNYDFVEGSNSVIVPNGSYNPTFLRVGDVSKMYVKAPAGDDFIEQSDAFEATATVSPILGYIFNDGELQTEIAAVNTTIQEYLPRISCGMCQTEEEVLALLDEFNQKLEIAGINDIIAENQRQLDEFLASK